MARLARWATTAGGTALATLTHGLPLLILVVGGVILAGLVALVWILSDDRRAERLNLLLRGDRLPRSADAEPTGPPPTEPLPAGGSEARSSSNSQTMDYAGFLRRAGRPDLAELLEQSSATRQSAEPGAAESEGRTATRPRR